MRYGLLLARGKSIARIVYCLAAALIMEPVVRLAIESAFTQTARICVAASLPLVATGLLYLVRRLTSEENDASAQRDYAESDGEIIREKSESNPENGSISRALRAIGGIKILEAPTGRDNETRRRFILLFATALLLATVRTLSPVGTWDAEFDPLPMTSSPELVLLYAVCVILFARFTLVNMESRSALGQFQPAFLIIVLTLLASLLLLSMQGPQSAILYTLMCLDDSFAHMLFWASVARMVRNVYVPSYRIVGLGIGLYAIGSAIWLLPLGDSEMMQAPVMVAAIATLYVLSIVMINIGGPRHAAHANAAQKDASPAPDKKTALADRIAASIEERCLEISHEYGLSPRETEVITLLAQGRTRLYIQEELVLAENTVKTHISHIYKKLGVNNRQDMLDLVFGKSDGEE